MAKTIHTEFKSIQCPHCEQFGLSAALIPIVEKNEVVAYRCRSCKSFWDGGGALTKAPKQSALRKLFKK